MIIGSIAIRMSADAQPFLQEVSESADALDRVAASAERAQAAFAGLDLSRSRDASAGDGDSKGAARTVDATVGQFDILAARVGASLRTSLAPISNFAGTLVRQFNIVGGTIVEVSRRVSSALKFIGGESMKNLYKDQSPNPEKFGVEVNRKTLKDVLGLTHQVRVAARGMGGDFKEAAKATQGIDAKSFDAVAKALNLIALSLDTATRSMDRLGASAESAARQMAKAARAAAGVKGFGGPGGPQPKVRKAAGGDRADANHKGLQDRSGVDGVAAATRGVAREVTAVDRLFAHVNATVKKQIDLVDGVRKKLKDLGTAPSSWSQRLLPDKKFTPFLSDKDPVKGLGKLPKMPKLDQSAGQVGALRNQFRTLAPVVDRAASSVKGLGAAVAVGLGLAGLSFKAVQLGVGFLKSGIAGASDLNETVDKTGHVFGASASIIVRAGDEMSKSFGLSKREFIDGATNLGRFGKAAGLSQDASARLGVDLARLGADLASIENIDTATAMQRLSSGIAGETEVLRKHGALLSEERIKQEAVTKGWSDGKGELSEQTKVMSRVSLIFKDLKDAQGNLAETADSPANAMRRFHGQVENLATAVGQMLLPAVSKALEVASEFVTNLAAGFDAMKAAGGGFVAAIVEGFDTIGFALRNLPDFARIAWLKIQEGAFNLLGVLEVLPVNLGLIADYIAGNWKELIRDAFVAFGTYIKNSAINCKNLFFALQDLFSGKGWHFDWTPMLEGFKATAAELPQLLQPQVMSMQSEIDSITDRIGRRESERKKTKVESVNPTLPDFTAADKDKDGKKKKKGGREDKDVAALEFGSKEAASAVAKYRNEGSDQQPAKATAKNTEEIAKAQRETLAYLKRALDNKDPVKLAIAKL